MGSFCSSDDKSTSTTAPDPRAAAAYGDILSRAQQVGSQPYSPYGGQLTAGLDPTQQAGISNINAAYGQAQPWFNQAGQYAQQGAGAVGNISGADIQQYYNPYQQAVIDATMGNINEADQRQQQMVKGNAAMSGALGGDRQAVAQAELARQQGLARNQTLAGLQSQGYSQALAAAQSQQANQQQNAARALQGAGVYGNLGAGAQQAQLQGAGAQLGAGQIAQQTEQARLSALYNQFQQQQAFPYQQLGWLSGITAPIGSQMGSTTTVDPADPSMLSQIVGLGATAAGAFMKSDERSKENVHRVGKLDDGQPVYRFNYKGSPYTQIGLISQEVEKDHPEAVRHVNGVGMVDYDAATADAARAYGGRVGYADGGPTDFINDVQTYIPRVQIQGRPLQSAQFPSQDKDKQSSGGSGGLAALANLPFASMGSGMNDFSGGMTSNFGFNSSTAPGYFQSNYGTADQLFPGYGSAGFADGGLVDTVRALRRGLGSSDDDVRETGIAELKRRMGGDTPWYKERVNHPFVERLYQGLRAHDISNAVPRRQYQDGGDVFEDRFRGSMRFEDRWDPVLDIPQRSAAPMPFMAQNQPPVREFDGGNWSPQEVAPQAMSDWRGGTDLAMADAGGPRVSPSVPLPPEITAGMSRPPPMSGGPTDALGYDRSPAAPATAPSGPLPGGFLGFLNNLRLSDEASTGLMAAGLGMMAARSPYALSNIGEGGLKGLEAMQGVRKEELAKTESKRRADAEARRMLEDMKRFDLDERKFRETQRQHDQPNLRNSGATTEDGHPILFDPKKPGVAIDGITGKPLKPDTKVLATKDAEPNLTPAALNQLVERSLEGDYSWKQNLGRGRQSGANIIAVENELSKRMTEMGISGADMARKIREFKAETMGAGAASRTLATQEAKMGTAGFEALGAIKLARGVMEKVPRTSFLPINKLIEGFQKQTLNPDQAELFTRTQAIINTYAAVMARGAAVTTDSSRHRAEELLQTAANPEVYNRVLSTLESEINMALNSPAQMREFYKKHYGAKSLGETVTGPAANAPATTPTAGQPNKGDRKQFKQGWGVWDGEKWVAEKP